MGLGSQMLSYARNRCFWAVDWAGGGIIRKAYEEIRRIDALDSDAPMIQAHQAAAWKKLKRAACSGTGFYSGMENRRFLEFPVITKNVIRSSQDAFLSKEMDRDGMVQMATSGSTGTPFICYQDKGKKKRVSAECIFYSEKVGYRLGDNLSYIRTLVRQNRKPGWKQFMQNQTMIDCRAIDGQGVEKMLEKLRGVARGGGATVLAYGSTWTAVKEYAESRNLTYFRGLDNVSGLISGSDMLFDGTREAVSSLFGGVPMASRYSNEENGVIGQDEGRNNVFVVNEADYMVEICDDGGNRLPEGELGRIVVTDLYNYGMPMIRYDTGDVGAIETLEMNGRRKRCICRFSGRQVDVISDTSGKALSPHVLANHMWSFPDVGQFQVVQTGEKAYTLRLNLPDGFCREGELMGMMRRILGQDADLSLELVDEIPVLASGKRRYVINEWRNGLQI